MTCWNNPELPQFIYLSLWIYAHVYNIHIPSCRSMEVIYTNACSYASTFVLGSHFVFLRYECPVVYFHPQLGKIIPSVNISGCWSGRARMWPSLRRKELLLFVASCCWVLVPGTFPTWAKETRLVYIIWHLYTMNTTHILRMIHGCTCLPDAGPSISGLFHLAAQQGRDQCAGREQITTGNSGLRFYEKFSLKKLRTTKVRNWIFIFLNFVGEFGFGQKSRTATAFVWQKCCPIILC